MVGRLTLQKSVCPINTVEHVDSVALGKSGVKGELMRLSIAIEHFRNARS